MWCQPAEAYAHGALGSQISKKSEKGSLAKIGILVCMDGNEQAADTYHWEEDHF